MVSHMNSDQRDKWWPLIVNKQHYEGCRGCGIDLQKNKPSEFDQRPQGIIDHIDNVSTHNILKNLQILCRSCNKIKNPSKTYEPPKILTQSEATNLRVEDAWREWVMDKVLKNNGYEIEELINSGAELFKVSPDTIRYRYMAKITSMAGKFKAIDGMLYLKSMEIEDDESKIKGAISSLDL